jgi:hypothetical protein
MHFSTQFLEDVHQELLSIMNERLAMTSSRIAGICFYVIGSGKRYCAIYDQEEGYKLPGGTILLAYMDRNKYVQHRNGETNDVETFIQQYADQDTLRRTAKLALWLADEGLDFLLDFEHLTLPQLEALHRIKDA